MSEVYSEISPEPIAAASLGQVYRGRLAATGEEVAIKVQRPGIEPIIYRDLVLFRALAALVNQVSQRRLGCNAQLIVDEFGEKLLEELDYVQEGRNLSEFYANFYGDAVVKIPKFYPEASGGERADDGVDRRRALHGPGGDPRRGRGCRQLHPRRRHVWSQAVTRVWPLPRGPTPGTFIFVFVRAIGLTSCFSFNSYRVTSSL